MSATNPTATPIENQPPIAFTPIGNAILSHLQCAAQPAKLGANGAFLAALAAFLATPAGQALETALVNMLLSMIAKASEAPAPAK
jgi:hypothetical protein